MKPGRRPIPNELKRLAGNPGHRPIRPAELELPASTPVCPSHLDARARAEWKRITDLVAPIGLLRGTDQAVLAAYCQCYSRWVEAEEKLRTTGPIVLAVEGTIIENPYLAIATRALTQLRYFMVELGFTPATRTSVPLVPSTDLDDSALFARRTAGQESL
jgi:P27 family predicted phage terminase small subunit